MIHLFKKRLFASFSKPLTLRDWRDTGLAYLVFASLAFPLAVSSQLFQVSLIDASIGTVLVLMVIAVFTPSMLEEGIYRSLLFPLASEDMSKRRRYGLMSISLGLYVVVHPLVAWLVWPWARSIFYQPFFLIVVTLLGLTCTFVRWRTGSVWSAVLIHWATIVIWKVFFGGPDFNLTA